MVSIDLELTNSLIARFGAAHRVTMQAERRATMSSALFDLPRRSSLGWEAIYEHAGALVSELAAVIEPEELGRRMRGLGCRPYTMQPFILACGYLAGRQQHLLDAGVKPGEGYRGDDPQEIEQVVGYWAGMLHGQRDGNSLMPEENDGVTCILDPSDIEIVQDHLRPVDDLVLSAARKMAATLDLYAFILHGEQRDGIGGHGPYHLPDGSTLFIKEFNDLRNKNLPWASTEVSNTYENVILAYTARDVTVRCNLFGSMVVEPHDLGGRITGLAVMTRDSTGVHNVGHAVESIREAASLAQEELYMRAITWDDRYRITYGAALFANHFEPLFTAAGIDGSYPRIEAAFEGTADRIIDELDVEDLPSIWSHFGEKVGNFYCPVIPAQKGSL